MVAIGTSASFHNKFNGVVTLYAINSTAATPSQASDDKQSSLLKDYLVFIPIFVFTVFSLFSLFVHQVLNPAVFHKPISTCWPDVSLGLICFIATWLASIALYAYLAIALEKFIVLAFGELAVSFAAIG